jgi:hypothetical protein
MHVLHGDVIGRIAAGDDETRQQMRVLHEEVISRIALLGEEPRGDTRRRGPKSQGRKKRA